MQPEVSSSYCLGFGLQLTEGRNKKTPEESEREAESQVRPWEPQPGLGFKTKSMGPPARPVRVTGALSSATATCQAPMEQSRVAPRARVVSICTDTCPFCTLTRQQNRHGNIETGTDCIKKSKPQKNIFFFPGKMPPRRPQVFSTPFCL